MSAAALLGPGLARAFKLLDICIEEANAVGNVSSELWQLCAPNEVFAGPISPEVYRSHVRELLTSAKAGRPLDVGTEAEVLIGLMYTSQVAPLTDGGALLYHYLFPRIMGQEAYTKLPGGPCEQWAGQTQELLTEARKKVRTSRPRKVNPHQRKARRLA